MMRDFVVLALCAGVMGCGPSIVGRACDSSDPCPTNFVCASTRSSTGGRCMRACSMSTETVCSDGTACLPLDGSGTGACYLGGTVGIGQSCMYDSDCTRTGICVSGSFSSECVVGCNADGSHPCSSGFGCLPTAGSAYYCAPMM